MPDREPWQCPSCRAWIRPDIETHRCDPDGGVAAGLPASPKKPPALAAVGGGGGGTGAGSGSSGGATSVTWTFPAGTVVTRGRQYETDMGQPVTFTLNGYVIFEAMQQESLRYNRRNSGGGGGGDAA